MGKELTKSAAASLFSYCTFQAALVLYVNNDVYYVVFHVNITSKL